MSDIKQKNRSLGTAALMGSAYVVGRSIGKKKERKPQETSVNDIDMSKVTEGFTDKVMDRAIEKDAKRVGYDPKKAGKRFYDGPVSAVKGTAASALTGFAINPITMTNLYKAKARTDRVNRQRVYAGIKNKFKGNSHEQYNK